jgi:hypothetical protein
MKQEFSKLGFEIGDFWRKSGFVEIEGLKRERERERERESERERD